MCSHAPLGPAESLSAGLGLARVLIASMQEDSLAQWRRTREEEDLDDDDEGGLRRASKTEMAATRAVNEEAREQGLCESAFVCVCVCKTGVSALGRLDWAG